MQTPVVFRIILFSYGIICATGYSEELDSSSVQFSKKCMAELGCFDTGPPFYDEEVRYYSFEPENRETINTEFRLYAIKNRHSPVVFSNMKRNDTALHQSGFKAHKKTIFYVEGFLHQFNTHYKEMVDAFRKAEEDVNFFFVQYRSTNVRYVQMVANMRVVGAEIAVFLQYLQETIGLKYEKVHLIGHSLGAHAAGYAGKRLKGQIYRITGLSPAGPYFTHADPVVRLDRSDAKLVDCIHSDSAETVLDAFGTNQPICDLNFYPNGGIYQPNCPSRVSARTLIYTLFLAAGESILSALCDHNTSLYLFITSLTHDKDCPIFAKECDSWKDYKAGRCRKVKGSSDISKIKKFKQMKMGYYCDREFDFKEKAIQSTAPLSLYFKTTMSPPYCLSEEK